MANEEKKPQSKETPKKPDVNIEPLSDDALSDVSGGICSAAQCSSATTCLAEE
jgi:hypothetical protein